MRINRNKNREETQVVCDPNPIKAKGCEKRLSQEMRKYFFNPISSAAQKLGQHLLDLSDQQYHAPDSQYSYHAPDLLYAYPALDLQYVHYALDLQYAYHAPDPQYAYHVPDPQYAYLHKTHTMSLT
ncbi:hypothetical protein Adt_26129 [Abeliophyllum distichum]|uniref:Uncharacterized protein n=1 Tax=Abeliophyllum distichum TaxID=126358 RepID=A0ABD1RQQ6_9LAMI